MIKFLIAVPIVLAITTVPVRAQQPSSAAGLDALDENRVMTELANRGMETLLKREFEVKKTPPGQQSGVLTLISIRKLQDPALKLTPGEKQDLLEKISKGIVGTLPSISDPTALMQIAKTLITVGVDPLVNAMEYFGENAKTQAQLRPIVETVLKIYDRAADEANKRADAIANKLTPNDAAGAARWQAADDLRALAVFSGAMAQY